MAVLMMVAVFVVVAAFGSVAVLIFCGCIDDVAVLRIWLH